jgi:hypothetical protein
MLRMMGKLASDEGIEPYLNGDINTGDDDMLVNTTLLVPDNIKLHMPGSRDDFEFENSKIIFDAYKTMTPVQATDARIWAYLTHITFWSYMKARRPVNEQPRNKRRSYILEHWFVERIAPAKLMRNDISLLWWGAYLTYDQDRSNPYELTEELFSMLDYTRHLLPGTQGRNKNFTHAVLEFVLENRKLFSQYKESKVRFLMRRLNYIAGYKIFPVLTKGETKAFLERYRKHVKQIGSDKTTQPASV